MSKIWLIFWLSLAAAAQTGGAFQIENPTIAAGGGKTAGGSFALDATAGQTLAGGRLQNERFAVQNGFWTSGFAPTAARVSVGGRVMTGGRQGIRNARVILTMPDGAIRFTTTGSFGDYRFESVATGETYVLTVFSRRYLFPNPTLVATVTDERHDLDFTAIEPAR